MSGSSDALWETAVSAGRSCTGIRAGRAKAGITGSMSAALVRLFFFAVSIGSLASPSLASFKTNVYAPTPEIQAQFIADATSQYQATLTHNLASDTLTLLSRNAPAAVLPSSLDKAVDALVAVTTWSYVYGYANGMEAERGANLKLLSDAQKDCKPETCAVLATLDYEIKLRSYPDYQAPASTPTCTLSLDKTSFYSGAPESNWTVRVTSPENCWWQAFGDVPWIACTVSNGLLNVRAESNAGPFRTGHVIVGGVSYPVSQEGP